ncbi:hypothetical protein JOE61_000278 [Nocardioides salarius]|uniref:YobI-like P-loop NTPase domain-containing protein n=1 Tax=Nocardioides salarius TaxID=374513 RepID=A0ABS2M5K1_9ACTN|nr:hypothetical protein [Nocardioides salarius]MBM7506464.1 hypothetical protein [Nocardioides salarius]
MSTTTASTQDPTEGAKPRRSARPAGPVTLRSLAPEYVEEQHSLYLRHLNEAVSEKKNRNIALTGRYGSGKSSVLDQFEEDHKDGAVRISINTLGPDAENEGLTNRIQKELVKQLIYRAKPGLLRRSRFARTAPLTKGKAAAEAAVLTAVLGALLTLLDILPHVSGTGDGHNWFVRISASVTFAVLAFAVIWLARWVIGDRVISQFQTAGTAVQLEAGPDTYFDKYLDELVTYFVKGQ